MFTRTPEQLEQSSLVAWEKLKVAASRQLVECAKFAPRITVSVGFASKRVATLCRRKVQG